MELKIDDISILSTVVIYKVKHPLSKNYIKDFFKYISDYKNGRYLLYDIRSEYGEDDNASLVSYCVFKSDDKVNFCSMLRDTVHSFILFVECSKYVFVFKDKVNNINSFLNDKMEKLSHNEIFKVASCQSGSFESISLRGLALSNQSIRSKSFEATDLKRSMSLIGSNRQIVGNVKKRADDSVTSVTVSSSRVSRSGERIDIDSVISWTSSVVKTLDAEIDVDPFLSNFAQPISYEDNRLKLMPIGVYFSLDELESQGCALFFTGKKGRKYKISNKRMFRFYTELKNTLPVVKKDETYSVQHDSGFCFANLRMNKKTITVSNGFMKRIVFTLNDNEISLSRYINQKSKVSVAFSDPKLIYANRNLYSDSRIIGDVGGFIGDFIVYEEMNAIVSEKGNFNEESDNFEYGSLFRFVEDRLAINDDYLFCDDLGDEWADHIGFSSGENGEPSLSFYISKHKQHLTTSASSFHDVVGQAIKNLSRMFMSSDEFKIKLDNSWRKNYKTQNIMTKIPCVRKVVAGSDILSDFERMLSSPSARRNVYLVVDYISKKQLSDVLMEVSQGKIRRPHYIQLFWMLSTYLNICRDMGLNPKVVCSP